MRSRLNLDLSEKDVAKMLSEFWRKYLAIDKKAEALKILGIQNKDPITRTVINNRYKKLANIHHPDRGGCKKEFIKIKQATEELKVLFD